MIQLLFDEKKIITEREGNLILATASDDIFSVRTLLHFVRASYARFYLDWIERKLDDDIFKKNASHFSIVLSLKQSALVALSGDSGDVLLAMLEVPGTGSIPNILLGF